MITVYGIPNCDTTKKAITVLQKNETGFQFHNYKRSGITAKKLNEWIDKAGIEKVFNKRSTTFKELSETDKKKAGTTTGAIALMINHNSIIKRPIIESSNKLIVGFSEKEIKQLIK